MLRATVLAALAAAAAAQVGAGRGQAEAEPVLRSAPHVTVSPDGDGINDVVRLRVTAPPRASLTFDSYVWGGRNYGWRPLASAYAGYARAGVTSLSWRPRNRRRGALPDGTYVLTVCRAGASQVPFGGVAARPGLAEASVARPPWRRRGCLNHPVVVSVRRLSVAAAAAGSWKPGSRVPLLVGSDRRGTTISLAQDGTSRSYRLGRVHAGRPSVTLPRTLRPGLHHLVAFDGRNRAYAPLVVRNGAFSLTSPPARTALVVWPYLTWRAYNISDGDGDGRPDTWYQFWRQRRVTLVGPLLPARGVEDDHPAVAPFSAWLAARSAYSTQAATDLELGSLPAKALRRYAAIVFPGHTEYYDRAIYDAVKRFRDRGGNVIFLQTNPFYRVVRIDYRRNAIVMTRLEARGRRSDYALAGVGFDGCCFPRARFAPYVAARKHYAKVAWLFAHTGIGPGQPFGRIGGESDRSDPQLTPRNHVVAAQALFRGRHGVVRAEMVVAKAKHGGTVFAAGNYDFLRIRKRTPSGRRVPAVILANLWKRLVLGR